MWNSWDGSKDLPLQYIRREPRGSIHTARIQQWMVNGLYLYRAFSSLPNHSKHFNTIYHYSPTVGRGCKGGTSLTGFSMPEETSTWTSQAGDRTVDPLIEGRTCSTTEPQRNLTLADDVLEKMDRTYLKTMLANWYEPRENYHLGFTKLHGEF